MLFVTDTWAVLAQPVASFTAFTVYVPASRVAGVAAPVKKEAPVVVVPVYQVNVYPAVTPPTLAEALPLCVGRQLVWLVLVTVITGSTVLSCT